MPAAYQAFINLATSFQAGTVLLNNFDGQGLHMRWNFTRTVEPEPDQGEVRISNLSLSVRKQLQAEKVNLPVFKGTFMQGWQGVPSLLFFADIVDIVPEERTNDPTTPVTIIRMGDGLEGYRDATTAKTFSQVDVNTVLEEIALGMEIVVGLDAKGEIAKAIPGSRVQQFKKAFVAMGSNRDIMNELLGLLKLRWTIQNGELRVFPEGSPISGLPAIVLSPHTGLISWTTARDGAIELHALSMPECTPGRQVIVQDEFGVLVGEPSYRVERASYAGDSNGGAFMDIYAKKDVF